MGVVVQDDVAVRRGSVGHARRVPVLGDLDQRGRVVLVVLGVEVGADDVVAELAHEAHAVGAARQERRAHVRREPAKDVAKGHLVVDHLRLADRAVGRLEVLVRPGVVRDLVARVVRALDDGGPRVAAAVDLALAHVVARDEEGGLDAEGVQLVEQLAREALGAVVICQCDLAGRGALGDDGAYAAMSVPGAVGALPAPGCLLRG